MIEFEVGQIATALQLAALGVKPATIGVIRARDRAAFMRLAREVTPRGLHVAFGAVEDGRVEWRASRWPWALDALAWLDAGGRAALGNVHLHWVQGLLFGYSPDAIADYLARLSAPASSSRPSARSHTAGTSRLSIGESSSRRNHTGRHQTRGSSIRSSA